MHSDMDQNGSFFMTEGVDEDEEENDFLDLSESSSSKTPKLENGRHRKHLQRPRKSLQEFERMEKILHSQNGFADDDEFDPDVSYKSEICRTRSVDSQGRTESSSGGSAGRRGKSKRSRKESDNSCDNSFRSSMEEQSGSEYEYRGHNGMVSRDDLREEEEDGEEVRGISLSDGAPPDEDQDPSSEIIMMKYMEETPRAGSSGMHENSRLSDRSVGSNTNSNNNIKNSPRRRDQYEDITDSSIKSENMVSLNQEQPPSHLERVFDDDDDATDEQSEFGETVIPAGLEEAIQEAALNVQEFGSDADDRRQSESSVSLGRFKPVAVNGRKFKKPPARRSSRDTATKGRVSSPSGERTVGSAFVPYGGDTSMNSEGDDAQTKGEAAAFRARTSSRIPALNLAHMTDTEAESDTPRSKEELSSRLTEERKTRRQATNVNHQLQIEYDELLAKYAEAENTIDHLRLGAVVNIRSDPPPNGQMSRGQLTPAKQPMAFDIGVPQRGRYSMGESSRKQSDSSPQNATFGGNDRQPIQEHHTQTVIQEMKYSVANLAQQVPLLERAIDTKQVPVEEQESLFDHLKKAHGELEEDYMQRREEAREQQRWNSILLDSEENQFDPERSLEGQIFQVGIQLEDLQEKVEENVRNNPPTMATRSRHSSIRQKSVDEDIPKRGRGGPQDDPEYSQMLQQYEALKQLPGTPKRDKEIQRLVKEIDNLQMTSKDDGEHGYISERSDWSDTPSKRRQSLKERKEKGYSSGRDTPSSAHSLEERKATITEEKQTRNPRKIVKSLPAFPRKASDTAIDSGSSHPRSPEHEVDSGFVGSEGSRQSQKSKQNNIPRSKTTGGSHRLRPESGVTRIEESRLKRAQHHHTPIQELSERGQHSSSQSEGKRRSLPSRKLEPVTVATSEEEEVEGKNGSFERPVRMSRRSATPSRHQSSQHHIVSPLPSKPKLQDFQRRSEQPRVKKPSSSRKTESISSRVTPKTSERDKIRSEIISKRMTEPKSQKSGAGLVDPRLERLRNRRNSDVPSSVSKSVKSEELQALKEELAGLRQELSSPKNRQRTRRKSPGTERGYYSSAGEREYMSADEGYTGGTTPDAHERSSLKSDRSAKSERLAELKVEVALLRKDLRDSEAANRSGVRSTPSATSTPHPRRTYRTDLPQKEKYRSDDPVDRLKASSGVRDSLRETLRKKFIPTSRSHFQVEPSEEYYEDDNLPQLEYSVSRSNPRMRNTYRSKDDDQRHLREHYSHGGGGGGGEVEYEQSRQDYQPLSSLEQRPQRHSRMSTAPRETSTPCGHCNGSGVHHHAQIGPDFTHQLQQPPLQQAPIAYVQTSPSQTVYAPAGSPIYHSTPAVVQHAPGTPNVMQAPVIAQVAAGGSLPHQHATLGTVIGNTTVTPPPQGNVTYTHHPSLVPLTVLSSSPQMHTLPQTVTVSPPQTLSSSNGATIDGARPVYLLPSSKGRYYIRDEPQVAGESDVEEIIYRRTPVRRSGSRKARKVEIHSQVEVEDERELDDSLFAACQMAQRLKQSSEKVLESVQSNLQKSALRRQLEY